MSKYLVFEENDRYHGKTKLIAIISKKNTEIIGEIKWYGAWRQYAFFPLHNTIWNKECMKDIINYIDKLMSERRKNF